MHAEIKAGFDGLAIEREKLNKILNDKGDIGTKRLEFWPLFNAACVIAKNYRSENRQKLKLEMAVNHLNDAKSEMEKYGLGREDFLNMENALTGVIKTIDRVLVIEKYKLRVSDMRMGSEGAVSSSAHKSKGG